MDQTDQTMSLSEELKWRGFINQTTLPAVEEFDSKDWVAYHGFDASADSQTIGNLAAMMLDLVFARHGHKLIVLAGGATSLIGDPGGKDVERPLLSEEEIANNVAQAEKQIRQIYKGVEFTLVNNLDWLKDVSLLTFLRDVGKHFGMSTLVQRDYIAKRIGEGGSGMSFTEFSYTLLQGYDFLHLHQNYGCNLQLAGSDQWGNSLSGVDLVRKVTGDEVHALTLPLIVNKSTGKKFGKSEDGAIWLDPNKTSPFAFYQFWLNVDDAGAPDYVKVYTQVSPAEFAHLESDSSNNPSKRTIQKYLAHEVTKLVHGEETAQKVQRITEILFGESSTYDDLTTEDMERLTAAFSVSSIPENSTAVDTLVASGLSESKGEARRLIENGGITVNGRRIANDFSPQQSDTRHGMLIIRKGKNSVALVKVR